jgi:hypothetical protein
MECADRTAYERYDDHPAHIRFVQERRLSEVATSSKSTTRPAENEDRAYRLTMLWISTISGGPASSTPFSLRIGIRR